MLFASRKAVAHVAEKMDCTESNVYKLHNRALREIKVPDILQDSSKFQ